MLDLENVEKFIELRAKGWSYNRIAKQQHLGKPTLVQWGRRFDREIQERQKLELEALMERQGISRVKRIEILGQTLKAVTQALNARNLSSMKTEKLIDLVWRYTGALRQEACAKIPLPPEFLMPGTNGADLGQSSIGQPQTPGAGVQDLIEKISQEAFGVTPLNEMSCENRQENKRPGRNRTETEPKPI